MMTKTNSCIMERREKKKKSRLDTINNSTFVDHYMLTGTFLGSGSFSRVEECQSLRNIDQAFAVKIIEKKTPGIRSKVFKEIETYHICNGHENIINLLEYFEDPRNFYLIFEKLNGGPLLNFIQSTNCLTEQEASKVVKDLARYNKAIPNNIYLVLHILSVLFDSSIFLDQQ
jgi:MAP kinase interacting serine/threonine kinase